MSLLEFSVLLLDRVVAFRNMMEKDYPDLEDLSEEDWMEQFLAFLEL